MQPLIPKRTRRLRARTATMNPHHAEYEDYGPEPNMKLSHAFMVVLMLHVIAVGGLYAFNSMKAGKTSNLKIAKTTAPVQQVPEPSNQQEPKQEKPGSEPPKKPHSPVVAQVTDAAENSLSQTAKVSSQPSKGFFGSARLAFQKAMSFGVAGVTGSLSKAAAQDSPSSVQATGQVIAGASTQATAKTYLVKSGDTITRIASNVGVTIPDLEKANGLGESSVLRVGQTLKIPEKAPPQPASDAVSTQSANTAVNVQQLPGNVSTAASVAVGAKQTNTSPNTESVPATLQEYTVVKGDSPYKIAKRFKITPEELMKANGITDPKRIQIGQKLNIPASTRKSSK